MRKLMWFSIGFWAACTLFTYFYVPEVFLFLLLGMLLAVCFGFLSRKVGKFAILALVLFGFSTGSAWFWVQDRAYLSHARQLDGETVSLTVRVTDYSEDSTTGCVSNGSVKLGKHTYSVRLYLDPDKPVFPGYEVTGDFRVRFTADGGGQEPTSHRTEGIYLLLYQKGDVEIVPGSTSWRDAPAIWRNNLLQRLDAAFPEDAAGFAKALLLGDRSGIDYETNIAFKVSGISHIIAVSGLHVSILFGLLYTLTLRKRGLTALIGIPALMLFAAIVGFTPSITRACIMQSLMLLAMVTEREYDPPTELAFSVLVILAVNPMAAASISFQLSVGCMVGIFLFYERIRQWFHDEKRLGSPKGKGWRPWLKRWFTSSVSVTISASVITTPLVAWYFGTISLIGIATNLLTLWVVNAVFYGLVLICAVSFLSAPLAAIIAWLVAWPIRYILGASKLLSHFPMAAVYTESVYIVIWLIACYGMLTAFLLCKKKYPIVFACTAAITLCIALLLSWAEPLSDNYRMTVLDVGQGQCILLQTEGKTFLVDCGGDYADGAADKAAEHLLSQGVDHLDGIILTHYDEDHAGGVAMLLSRIPADALYLPDIIDNSQTAASLQSMDAAVLVQEDTVLSVGQAKITIFASETQNAGNESGLCILFQRENCDILITGDRGELGEMLLMRRINLPELDVLVAGHHGSAGSTGDALLSQTMPQTVIVSAGKNNRYGHPAPALLQRLAQWGCTVYRTDLQGTIIYRG